MTAPYRCDSRHWPRPVYYVNNNYYVKGRRPQHDWDRPGHDGGHHDGDGHREHGDRFIDAVRDQSRRASEQEQHERNSNGRQRQPDADGHANGDGQREHGDRFIDAVRDQEQRDRTRGDPSGEQRQPVHTAQHSN